MFFYAPAAAEILNRLRITEGEAKQVWLEDDARGAGSAFHMITSIT